MSKFICYITTCSKNQLRAELCKQYFDKQGIEYYFVYGTPASDTVSPHLKFDIPESYSQLPLKTYHMVQHFLSTNADFMIKINDDTFVDFDAIPDEVYKHDYCGAANSTEKRKNNPRTWHQYKMAEYEDNSEYNRAYDFSRNDYINGGFYMLSRRAAQIIADTRIETFTNTPTTYIGEDIIVGYVLQREGIEIFNMSINDYYPGRGMLNLEITTNHASVHPVNPFLFPRLKQCTQQERQQVLRIYDFLNEYNKISEYSE